MGERLHAVVWCGVRSRGDIISFPEIDRAQALKYEFPPCRYRNKSPEAFVENWPQSPIAIGPLDGPFGTPEADHTFIDEPGSA